MAGKEDLNYDYLNDAKDSLEGFEEINTQTMTIPFLKLATPGTPQLLSTKACYIEGLKLGDFFNSATGEVYGPNLPMIILKFERIFIEWPPNSRKTGEGLIGYHTPENAKNIATDFTFGKWKHGLNDLTEYYTYYIVLPGHEKDGVMIYSLTSSRIKIAQSLNRLMTTHEMENGQIARPYYLVWDVTSKLVPKGDNEYYVPNFVFNSFVTREQHMLVGDERKALPDRKVDYAQITDGRDNGVEITAQDEEEL
jgi:hypothetical protein